MSTCSLGGQLDYTIPLLRVDERKYKTKLPQKSGVRFRPSSPLFEDSNQHVEHEHLLSLALTKQYTHLHIDFLDAMRDDHKHIPAPNSRKGQSIIFSTAELDAEPNQVDLTDFAVPIDNLLEPGMAEGTLRALDQIVIENMGTQLGLWRATQKPRDIH
ncbi:hypothetical protein E0Z10_g1996 [Xylaria hypoxylon]|uniref:Uncharacterized protein n=1 Tax=Xylaria hypoxylon TaxID=37992 RepID=A0A4Z0Z7F5_9PEZI|nr:hypothetical protein E0Z10_g1996 [Xylaria hypoxylon]